MKWEFVQVTLICIALFPIAERSIAQNEPEFCSCCRHGREVPAKLGGQFPSSVVFCVW